ncbi:MAG: hypothetical protein JWR69_556 [Pedosphaera sp.]|nr:hypothetical protein [Pedosphaera sp.]
MTFHPYSRFCLAACLLLWLPASLRAAGDSNTLPLVAKWGRFERSFTSAVAYTNPPQAATLTATFTSPLGETNTVFGFWDGNKIWRVRFSPDQPGRWSFKTTCSDRANTNLNNISGEFLCSSATGDARFQKHGPIGVARDRRHLEHQDHTPFFWLADTVWDGALLAKDKDWYYYARTRSQQGFTAAQWIAVPGTDLKKRTAFSGTKSIVINPDYFKQLDARVEILNRVGLLSAIVPLRDIPSPGKAGIGALPEDQVILLLRYMVARWGANDVAWILTCEGDNLGRNVDRWKRIGRAVFGDGPHAPVIVDPGESYWVLDEFRREPWVDLLGYQSGQEVSEDTLLWMVAGPVSRDWRKEPFRMTVNLALPYENEQMARSQHRTDPLEVRRAVYWSLLNAPASGVSYGAYGVWNWMADTASTNAAQAGVALPGWQKSLFLPAAKQMTNIATLFNGIDFWRLRPAPELIVNQPGLQSPGRHVAAARTENRDMALVYVPEDRTIELTLDALPPSPNVTWINPRTGGRSRAVAVIGPKSCQFPTPGAGDWLLLMTRSKAKL